jgi:curved DNA-binding protein CbpA
MSLTSLLFSILLLLLLLLLLLRIYCHKSIRHNMLSRIPVTLDFPDYYRLLGVSPHASHDEIRAAYKRLAIMNHPELPDDAHPSLQSREHVLDFQQLADAYYTLSDKERREKYDRVYFAQNPTAAWQKESVNPNQVFTEVYEDLIRAEIESPGMAWPITGVLSGAVLGFVAGNLPGAIVGGYSGLQLGRLRAIKGKSIYNIFMELDKNHRLDILYVILRTTLEMKLSTTASHHILANLRGT